MHQYAAGHTIFIDKIWREVATLKENSSATCLQSDEFTCDVTKQVYSEAVRNTDRSA